MYELTGATSEVVLYWENTDPQFANSKVTTVKGLYTFLHCRNLNGVGSDYFNPFYCGCSHASGDDLSHRTVFYVFSYSIICIISPKMIIQSMPVKFSGADAAFVGPNENQFAILDEDKTTLSFYMLPGVASQESFEKNVTAYENQSEETEAASIKGPMQFMFESEVDRIFSTPLGA